MVRTSLVALCVIACATDARAQNRPLRDERARRSAPVADKMSELGAGVVRVVFGWDVLRAELQGLLQLVVHRRAWRAGSSADERRDLRDAVVRAAVKANGGNTYNYRSARRA